MKRTGYIILWIDLRDSSNILARVGRPLATLILPDYPLHAVLRPESLEVALAASVLGVVPPPLMVSYFRWLPKSLHKNNFFLESCLPPNELLVFQNLSG